MDFDCVALAFGFNYGPGHRGVAPLLAQNEAPAYPTDIRGTPCDRDSDLIYRSHQLQGANARPGSAQISCREAGTAFREMLL